MIDLAVLNPKRVRMFFPFGQRLVTFAAGAVAIAMLFLATPPMGAEVNTKGIAGSNSERPGAEKPDVTPLPETNTLPKAKVSVNRDRMNVSLINRTNATIAYQVVGDTQMRTLSGRERVTLKGVRVPLTLTLDRQDSGLLDVVPQQSTQTPDTLEVTLNTTTDLAADGTTMTIEQDGSVFSY
jgi:hypothetical protein